MRIFLLGSQSNYVQIFRGDLLKRMAELGHDVYAVALDRECEQYFNEIGVKLIDISFNRTGTNPFTDLVTISKYVKLFKKYKPDYIYAFNIKPVIYGCIAAKICKIKNVYPLIPGVGIVFNRTGFKGKFIEKSVSILYKIALKKANKVFFQNYDDIDLFVEKSILPREKCVHVNGSGVNMKRFKHTPAPLPVSFLMIARLLKNKGVLEYCQCAQRLHDKYPDMCCKLIGEYDTNPNSLTEKDIQPFIDSGAIEHIRFTNEIPKYMSENTVFVLPTYYNEGLPHTILESMASGRAVITTAWKGGKDAVDDKETGLLIPIKDVDALYDAMQYMIDNPEVAVEMGNKAREKCCKIYDVDKVNDSILRTMGLIK